MAAGLAAALAIVAVGGLLFAGRLHSSPVVPTTASSARTSPTPSPSPVPTPSGSVAGVLATPPGPIILPNSGQLSVPSGAVVWFLIQDEYLYRSTDRGNTWFQRPIPPGETSLAGISFINGDEGWVSAGGQTGDCVATKTDIWHTTDAGATWAHLGSTGMAAARCKQGLSFVDPMHGFIGAWDANQAPIIYRTSDGGQAWTASQPLPNPPGLTQGAGSALMVDRVQAFGSTLLVRASGFTGNTWVEAVYRSTDGGATWIYLVTARVPHDDVEFISASRWLQISPGQSMETRDSGATWHSYTSDYGQAAPVPSQFAFGDSQIGYATVRGEIQLTIDGGLHWTEIKTPAT
jgi:photosystem II stability/assembly factor-like uncharacterized protein